MCVTVSISLLDCEFPTASTSLAHPIASLGPLLPTVDAQLIFAGDEEERNGAEQRMLRVGVASEKYIELPEAYNLAGGDKNK